MPVSSGNTCIITCFLAGVKATEVDYFLACGCFPDSLGGRVKKQSNFPGTDRHNNNKQNVTDTLMTSKSM